MVKSIFSSVKLGNGTICEIIEPTAFHLLRAQLKHLTLDGEFQVGLPAYFLKQVILIDGKNISLDDVFGLSIDDYNNIIEVIEVFFKKIKL